MIIALASGFILGALYGWAAHNHHTYLLATAGTATKRSAVLLMALRQIFFVIGAVVLGVRSLTGLACCIVGYVAVMIYRNWQG